MTKGNNGCSWGSLLKIEGYLGEEVGGEWSHDDGMAASSEDQGEPGLHSRVKNENISVRMIKTHSNEISIPGWGRGG